MASSSPLWPARLHHLQLNSDQPENLRDFYRDGVQLTPEKIRSDVWLMTGAHRRVLIARGQRGTLGFAAFSVADSRSLQDLHRRISTTGVAVEPSPTPLFPSDAFAVRDPQGHLIVFGVPRESPASEEKLPGRLQHVVVASVNIAATIAFYEEVLGFIISDRVFDSSRNITACFLRSDPEHHSFATFRAPQNRLDHHCYETTCWNDIRDWADHFASLRVPLWWGPGRHGPGNNLFFMIHDPDGNNLEFSAELEQMPIDAKPREWPHEERTLNYWGAGFMRS